MQHDSQPRWSLNSLINQYESYPVHECSTAPPTHLVWFSSVSGTVVVVVAETVTLVSGATAIKITSIFFCSIARTDIVDYILLCSVCFGLVDHFLWG